MFQEFEEDIGMAGSIINKTVINKTTFDNGLTIIDEKIPGIQRYAACAIYLVGTADDPTGKSGLHHNIEHMIGEKTPKYRDWTGVLDAVQSRGGSIDFYIGPEYTTFSVDSPKKHFPKAVRILCDVLTTSEFDTKVMKKQAAIIRQEIKNDRNPLTNDLEFHTTLTMSEEKKVDVPRMVYSSLLKILYDGNPITRDVAGTLSSLSNITLGDIRETYEKEYAPDNMIVSVVRGRSDKRFFRTLESYFGNMDKKSVKPERKIPNPTQKREHVTKKSYATNQCLLSTAFKLEPLKTLKELGSLEILNEIIDDRLQDVLRESRQYCYSPDSYFDVGLTYGFLCSQALVDTKNAAQAEESVMNEMQKLKEGEIDRGNFRSNKNYVRGMADKKLSGNSDDLAEHNAFMYLLTSETVSPKVEIDAVKEISLDDVAAFADKYLNTDKAVTFRLLPRRVA